MIANILKIGLFVLLLFAAIGSHAQPPFYNDVQALLKKDASNKPPENAILFTGSSSFTKWNDVQDYFPGYTIINRAFGGSSLPDLIYYADKVILPYQPKQIIIYCGDNDLAASDTVTAEIVKTRFIRLFTMIRQKLPLTNIVYVSIKPSPSRERLIPKMVEANKLIKTYLAGQRRTAYADVYSKMLLPNGKPDPTIFLGDNLHMNKKGYAIWQKVLYPYLVK